ncbi:MAG: hypothetical protein J5574_00140 [Lachnospiraceae bacterium]|nr:hypothetical protein [Lachnospiraceae bacterium]
MHIGFCENCRYTDLIENMESGCPRCGGALSPMGLTSAEWNAMSDEERADKIREKFPTHEDLWGPRVRTAPENEGATPEDAKGGVRNPDEPWVIEETASKPPVEKTDEWDVEEVPEEEPEELIEEVPEIVLEPLPEQLVDAIKLDAAKQETEQTDQNEMPVITEPEPENVPKNEPDDTEYVFVCYKCNSVAGHDRSHDRYYCTECGSDMVDVGYTVMQWADLSKEEKRKVSENAKIVHMVSEIKRDNYEESEADHTPSIIKVVKNPDSDYG